MYKVGDVVVYAGSSVCGVADIRKESFGKETKDYYVLKPVFERSSTVYHPVDGDETKLRKAVTEKEAQDMMAADFSSAVNWIENDAERNAYFDGLLKANSPCDMLGIISLIIKKKKEFSALGKKMRAADEKAFGEAKRKVLGEFSYVLNKSKEELIEIIAK